MSPPSPGPPQERFRLSMLIYDQRYRSLTIQIVFMMLLMGFAAWLVDNVITNLRAQGQDFSYRFLWQRAGYDINQTLVAYDSDMTHARAMFVGLLNTLLVAVLGCALATVAGVIVGVLRLSKNWLVSQIMAVYVEIFRNIPTLLWIIIFYTLVTIDAPSPRDFAGDVPAAAAWFGGAVVITNRGVYIPEPLFSNSLGSVSLGLFDVSLDFVALVLVIVASFYANKKLLDHARARQAATGLRPVTWWKSLLILFLPVIAALLALGFHTEHAELAGFNFQGGVHLRSSLVALWFGLGIYTSAFVAEIVRAGILAVSRGQTEAAASLGLRPTLTMRLVVLPQALRVIVPPLISQYLNLTKNTSLGLAVGYMDLRSTLGGITINQTGRALEGMLLMMLIYLLISLTISSLMNVYNSRIKLKER